MHFIERSHLSTVLFSVLVLALAVLLTPLPEVFGWEILAVQSGSMAPAISVGSIIAVRPVPAQSLRIGDVITFADRNQPDTRVTHRIVSLEDQAGRRVAVTKGDANNTTDSWSVPVDRTIGRVAFHVSYLGYLMVWLTLPPVKLGVVGLVGLLMVFPSFWQRIRGRKPVPESRPEESFASLADEIEALLGDSKRPDGESTKEATGSSTSPETAAT